MKRGLKKYMNFYRIIALVILTSTLGCASIVSGTKQDISFHSNPEGATVEVDGRTLGKTPLTFPLTKGEHQSVSFQKDGYKRLSLPMDQRLDGWFWGNIVFGGFLGSTTDGLSGAAHEYSPNQYMVSLEPLHVNRIEVETSKGVQQKAREFIVLGYSGIMTDLSRGKGDYLRSLFKVLAISEDVQMEATKKLRALSEVYTDIPSFADHAIELYLPQLTTKVVEDAAQNSEADKLASNWDDAKNGSTADRYHVLVSADPDHGMSYARSMRHSQKEELSQFILKKKGYASTTSWKFQIHPDLNDQERAFILSFGPLSHYTATGVLRRA